MRYRWIALGLMLFAATQSWSQAQPRPDPSDSKAAVPPSIYRSSFAEYRNLKDQPVANWGAANDLVGKIGGWREYAREAQGKVATPPAATSGVGEAPAKPSAGTTPGRGHQGH